MKGFFMAIGGLAVGFLAGRFYSEHKDGGKGHWSVALGRRRGVFHRSACSLSCFWFVSPNCLPNPMVLSNCSSNTSSIYPTLVDAAPVHMVLTDVCCSPRENSRPGAQTSASGEES